MAEVNSLDSDFDAETFVRRYNDLEATPERLELFENLAKNDEYGADWIRVVGSTEVDSGEIRVALDRVESIKDQGDVKDFKTASEANSHPEHSGNQPPIEEGSIAINYEIAKDTEFIRVYGKEAGPGGVWMMDPTDFDGLETRDDVLDHFALSEEWQSYDSVAKLEVDGSENLKVQVSTAGEIRDTAEGVVRPGDGTQYWILPNQGRQDWQEYMSLKDFLAK